MLILQLLGGLLTLTLGAESLVRGASALARALRISPLVIGLTIVAFGTSAPELVVSCQSAWRGQPDLAMGNVIGSNIFNVLFILGVSALIIPLAVAQQLIRFDVPVMIALSGLVYLAGRDGAIGRVDGILFCTGLVAYTTWAVVQSRKENAAVQDEYTHEFGAEPQKTAPPWWWNLGLLAVGLAMLIFGSRWFCDAGVEIARGLGVSELVIGLTLVAMGTSLPEVATSIMAAVRGERDIAVGNVVGSNIFNILGVLGISSVISPTGIGVSEVALHFDIPVMIAVAVSCLPIFFTGREISRWEGAVFLLYFCVYTTHLILSETNPQIHRTFGSIILGYVLPLTVLALAVSVCGAWKKQRAE